MYAFKHQCGCEQQAILKQQGKPFKLAVRLVTLLRPTHLQGVSTLQTPVRASSVTMSAAITGSSPWLEP